MASPPEPARRLPVTPGLAAAAAASARRVARGRGTFPLAAPTWPGGVPLPPVERTLGVDYDTEWARRYPARVARALLQDLVSAPLVRGLAAPEVHGADRIAHLDEPVIFAANHASHLDAPLVVSLVPERWRRRLFVAGAADYFFDNRVKAAAFALVLNAVPIDRHRVSRGSANRVAALLEDGWSMLIFPEGGRSPDGWGQPHRAGAAWLSVRTGRPLVPVHLEGTRAILPRGSARPRPGRTHLSFGSPLRPAPGDDPRELARRLEAAIATLADELATDWWTARRRAAAAATPSLEGPGTGAWRRAWQLGQPRAAGRRRRGPGTWPGGGAA